MGRSLRIRGPVHTSTEHSVLASSYFYLWVVQSWADALHFVLPRELRERVLDDLVPANWRATKVSDAIHQLAAQLGERQPRRIKLVLDGQLYGLGGGSADRPVTQLVPELFGTSIVPNLTFVRFDDPPAGQTLGDVINIKVVSQDGNEVFYRMRMRTPLARLMYAFCNRQGISMSAVRFLFDATRFNLEDTPEGLDMEDGDAIDVIVQQCGD